MQHRSRRSLQSEKGQISVMIGVMMMTFILLFAFVVNTGMLVNAKINLQNAADLAAFSGASVQARQLTSISYLNYEMRRQYKKFLFRTYVIGNMAQGTFPRSGGNGPMIYKPNPNSNINYNHPSTCVIFDPNENYCQLEKQDHLPIFAANPLDSIGQTIADNSKAIEKIRQGGCIAIGQTNRLLNIYWLFNADPTGESLINSSSSLSPDQRNKMLTVQSLITGLGLVPRELLLLFRIKTLAEYINASPRAGVDRSVANSLLSAGDPVMNERTISAFNSAFYTLGNHTFAGDKVMMDELLPSGSDGANLIDLKTIKQAFDTYAIDYSIGGNVGSGASDNFQDCVAQMIPIVVDKPMPVGVYKNPSILTYYAVRLRAEAKLLFWPFGTPPLLKAYASARPFGSRIGPSETFVQFATQGSASAAAGGGGASPSGNMPNLPVTDSLTWNTQEVVSTMFFKLFGSGGTGNLTQIQDMEGAYRAAMSPNPWEIGKYNIINNAPDSFQKSFSDDNPDVAAIWAPVFSPARQSQVSQTLKEEINSLFNGNIAGSVGFEGNVNSIQTTLQKGLEDYIGNKLSQGMGEDGEGLNVAKLRNPFSPNATEDSVFIHQENTMQYKTSWNAVNDSRFRQEGRNGYSVKFISFDSLISNRPSTNNEGATATNPSVPDEESNQDIKYLKH